MVEEEREEEKGRGSLRSLPGGRVRQNYDNHMLFIISLPLLRERQNRATSPASQGMELMGSIS